MLILVIVSRECEVLGKDCGFGGKRGHLRTVLCRNVTTLHYSNAPASGHGRVSRSAAKGVQRVRAHHARLHAGTLPGASSGFPEATFIFQFRVKRHA